MGYITNDTQGIEDKNLYSAIARQFKKGLFAPKKIDEDLARACTDLELEVDVRDLNFLRFFPNLDTLTIDSAALADIQGLRYVPNLDWLAIRNHSVSNISPLNHCPKLEFLQLSTQQRPQITDFRVIGQLGELVTIDLGYSGITEISWIKTLAKLQHVVIAHNPIADFSPLLELPAERLILEVDFSQNEALDDRFSRLAIEYVP